MPSAILLVFHDQLGLLRCAVGKGQMCSNANLPLPRPLPAEEWNPDSPEDQNQTHAGKDQKAKPRKPTREDGRIKSLVLLWDHDEAIIEIQEENDWRDKECERGCNEHQKHWPFQAPDNRN